MKRKKMKIMVDMRYMERIVEDSLVVVHVRNSGDCCGHFLVLIVVCKVSNYHTGHLKLSVKIIR